MKQAARWTAILALFTIPVLSLYIASNLYFPFITGKVFAFRILVEIALAAYVVLAAVDARYRPRFSWTLVVFGLLTAWMAIANAFGVHPLKAFWSNYERMDGWVTLVHVFIFFVVASAVLSVEGLWKRWAACFVGVAALVCLYGLVQLGGGAEIHQGGIRLTASLGNAIYLAVYLMFSLFLAAWLAATSSGWARYLYIGFMPLAFLVLFFTGSRGPLLGLFAGILSAAVLWMFLARNEWKTGASMGLKAVAGLLVALVVLVGGLFLVRDASFVQESPILSRVASVFSLNQELTVRATIWGIALQGVAEDPITGWGQEGFNQIFNKYYDPSLYEQESWFDRVHNQYLDWLVAGGVPALALFLGLLLLGALALLRAPNLTRLERVLLLSALVAYAVQAIVVFDNLFSYVPLAAILAMAHAQSGRSIKALEQLPEVREETGQAILGGAALVAGVLMIWVINVPGLKGANHLVYALSPGQNASANLALFKDTLDDNSFATQEIREQLVSFAVTTSQDDNVPEALRLELLTLAVTEMEKEIAISPNDARLRIQYASALEAIGQAEEAISQIDAAIALSPQKQALHLSKGLKLNDLGRKEEARASLMYAYELDPSFDRLAISVAAGHILTGDIVGGKALLVEAIGTTTPDNDLLFYAYYEVKAWNEMIAVANARVAATNGSPESRYRLAQALGAAGRFADARAEIAATIAAFPETRAAGEALRARMP